MTHDTLQLLCHMFVTTLGILCPQYIILQINIHRKTRVGLFFIIFYARYQVYGLGLTASRLHGVIAKAGQRPTPANTVSPVNRRVGGARRLGFFVTMFPVPEEIRSNDPDVAGTNRVTHGTIKRLIYSLGNTSLRKHHHSST